ncbi:MAG TPA: glycosyltransferase family 39 protein [Baekduia sp.]|nr:glycosyltransferase family 39 protein [Baekduia sp.]
MPLTQPARRPGPSRAGALRGAVTPGSVAVGLVLLAGLLLRLRNIDHGLPAVYHADEALHFTSRAVAMFQDGPNPHYFQNPSGFTYLVHLVLRFGWGHGWPFGSFHDLLAQYARDPTSIYVAARVTATVLCLIGVAAVYAAGRRLYGTAAGVAAAVVLCFAFLPVAYSRLALTDVAVFAPVAAAVYFAVRVLEDGRRRDVVLAGAAIGLAIGFKYTAGVLLLPLLAAVVLRGGEKRDMVRTAAWAVGPMVLVFLITTPFFLLDLHSALYQLKVEHNAAKMPKVGQAAHGTILFYLDSLTWGLGWIPAVAAGAGLVLEARRDWRRTLVVALFPLVLFAYIATADRYFARWLMPTYPVLALLAGVAFARLVALVPARPPVRAVALAALLAVAVVQPVLADVRTGTLLGREDTRAQTRDFLERTLPPQARIVVEPAVPEGFFAGRFTEGFGPPPKTDVNHAGSPTRFIRQLRPARIDRYRQAGFCVVVVMSLVHDRAVGGPGHRADRYYRRLQRESEVLFHASPYRAGAAPVPFDFDMSTHLYYPRAYERPGPDVTVYRLDRCREGVGTP